MPVNSMYQTRRGPSNVVTTRDELANRLSDLSRVTYTDPQAVALDYIRQNAQTQANAQWGGSAPQSAIDLFFDRYLNIAQNPQNFTGNFQAMTNPDTGATVSGDNAPVAYAFGGPDKFNAFESYVNARPGYMAAQADEMNAISQRMKAMQDQTNVVQGAYNGMGGPAGGFLPGSGASDANGLGQAQSWDGFGFGTPRQAPQQPSGGLGGLGGFGGAFSNRNPWAVG